MAFHVKRIFVTRNDARDITISVTPGAALQPMTYQEAAHHSSVISVGEPVMPRIYSGFSEVEPELPEEVEPELPEEVQLELPEEAELVELA